MKDQELKEKIKKFNEELEDARIKLFEKHFKYEKDVEYNIWKEKHPDGIYYAGGVSYGFANEHGIPTYQCHIYVYKDGKQHPYELTLTNHTTLIDLRKED